MAQVSKKEPEKKASAKHVTAKEELDIWIDKKLVAVTLDGEKIYFPEKIGLGKEIQLRNALSDKLSTIVGMFSTLEDSGELPEGAFSFFFKDFYELLPGLVSIVISTKGTQRSEEWVAENLDANTCQEIITPFFGNLLRMAPMQLLGSSQMAGMPPIGVQKNKKKSHSPK